MPLKDVFKVSRKTFFNPTGWLGYDAIRTQFATSWQIIKNLYTIPTAGPGETFEQARERFNLTDEGVDRMARQFQLFTGVLVACGLVTLLFSLYLLFTGSFAGFMIGAATAAVFWAYGFRYSFWRFEITHRKLGCTFDEWWRGKVSSPGDKPHVD